MYEVFRNNINSFGINIFFSLKLFFHKECYYFRIKIFQFSNFQHADSIVISNTVFSSPCFHQHDFYIWHNQSLCNSSPCIAFPHNFMNSEINSLRRPSAFICITLHVLSDVRLSLAAANTQSQDWIISVTCEDKNSFPYETFYLLQERCRYTQHGGMRQHYCSHTV